MQIHRLICFTLASACGGTVTGNDAEAPDAVADVVTESAMDAAFDAPPDSQTDGGACNTLINGATPLYAMQKSSSAPSPLGGTVVPGLYYLTAINQYDGKAGQTGPLTQSTIQITGTNAEFAEQVGTALSRGSVMFSTSGTTFTFNMTCPQITSYATEYTATATALIYYSDLGQGNVAEQIFTRQ